MIVTDNEAWGRKAKYLTTQARDNPVEYIHNEIGYNYRLTNIQAAMGCAQMELLDEYVSAKRRIASTYAEALKDVPGITPMREAPYAFSAFWLYTMLVDVACYGMDSRILLRRLENACIQARPLWQPLHRSPVHEPCQAYRCDVAEQLNHDALSLPSSVGLRPEDQERVIDLIHSISYLSASHGVQAIP